MNQCDLVVGIFRIVFTVRRINLSITTQYENVYTFVILLVFNMLQALFVNGTIESIKFHGHAGRNNFLCSIFVYFCSDGNSLCNINYIYNICSRCINKHNANTTKYGFV